MEGKRRTVTSRADCSTGLSTGSLRVAESRKKLFQFLRRAAGYIFAALSRRIQRSLRSGQRRLFKNSFIVTKSS